MEGQRLVSSRNNSSQKSNPVTPLPLPPRFAIIRKSYTLPSNMSESSENSTNANINNFRETVGSRQGSLAKRSSITCNSMVVPENLIRPRPSSLSLDKKHFLCSVSQENSTKRTSNRATFASLKPANQTTCMPVPCSMPATLNEV